jgi:hypothetical protein
MLNQSNGESTGAKSNVFPIIFAAVVVAGLGYLFLGDFFKSPTHVNSPAVEKSTAK